MRQQSRISIVCADKLVADTAIDRQARLSTYVKKAIDAILRRAGSYLVETVDWWFVLKLRGARRQLGTLGM